MNTPGSGGTMAQLDEYVEQLRQKLPVAPPGLMDAYVTWVPRLAIFFGVVGLLFSIVLVLPGAVLGPLMVLFGGAEGVRAGVSLFMAIGFLLVGSVLDIAGGYLMLKRQATGWWVVALSLVIGVLSNLLPPNIIGLVITLAIGYVHVHVRPRYI